MKSLDDASKMAKDNPYLYNQLIISLALLQIANNQIDKAQATFAKLGTINSEDTPLLQVYLTAYSFLWDPNTVTKDLKILKKSKWHKMPHYIGAIKTVQQNFDLKLNTSIDQLHTLDENRLAIVVLGFVLNKDGTMGDILINRLEAILKAYDKYPNAMVIVNGGGARNGTTESY